MDKNSIIAAKIKDIITEKNISQKFIAQGIGLGENAYSRIEGGHTKLVVDVLFKIAELLETHIEKILRIGATNNLTNNGNMVMSLNEGTLNIRLTAEEFEKFMN